MLFYKLRNSLRFSDTVLNSETDINITSRRCNRRLLNLHKKEFPEKFVFTLTNTTSRLRHTDEGIR
jgi:hypothetical protein